MLRNNQNIPKKRRERPSLGAMRGLDYEDIEDLWVEVGFQQAHIAYSGVKVLSGSRPKRFAFPIYGPMGVRRGWVLRTWQRARTKALTHPEGDGPMTSYYRCRTAPPDEWYLVEDIPSAVRAARYVNAVALLGTGMSAEALTELTSVTRNVTICLDQDATDVAFRLSRKLGPLFDSVALLPLEQDLKNLDEEALREKLGVPDNDNTKRD